MASPQVVSVDWGDVVTTTMENRSGKINDNVKNNNALLSYVSERGNDRPVSGGREIYEEIAYAENQSFMWFSGTEPLSIALNDTMTAARFGWKQCSVAVVISGLEKIMNAGDAAKMDLVAQRMKRAETTWQNRMSAGIYSDGTAYGGKQIGGVGLLVSKAPTSGLVGGIDRGQNPWWRNLSVNANLDTRGLVTSSNIQNYMATTVINLKRDSDGTDLIVFDNNYYTAFWSSLTAIQRVTDAGKKATAGFTALKFAAAGRDIDVVLDGGKAGQIPANTGYFLNTEYIWYRPSDEYNMKVVGGERTNINQDASVRLMLWAGNMTAGNLSLQGVLFQ